jgi:hypothetical protein
MKNNRFDALCSTKYGGLVILPVVLAIGGELFGVAVVCHALGAF